MMKCDMCGGSGEVKEDPTSTANWRIVCPECHGTGIMSDFALPPPEPNRDKYPLSDFMAQVAKRLEKGAVEYGAESYLTDNVTRQIEEELLDIAGWASLGWAKLKRVEELWKELRGLVGSEEG
jgi:hypothetical protein